MKIIEWKASNIKINYNANGCQMKGMLVAKGDNCVEYKIPYGAEGSEFSVAYNKTISEMCERAAWFNLYMKHPSLFDNTIGFSAHVNLNEALINSKREYMEHELLELLLDMASLGLDNVLDYFSIYVRKQIVIFHYSTSITEFVFVFRPCKLLNEKKGFVIGMGKDNLFDEAVIHATDESFLVENAINNYIKRGKVIRGSSLVDKEIHYFYTIFNNSDLYNLLEKMEQDYQSRKKKVTFSCDTIDLSFYVPSFLNRYNRKIAYCGDIDRVLIIAETLGRDERSGRF